MWEDTALRYDAANQFNQLLESTAFRHSPKRLELLFEHYVTSEQSGAIRAALVGIRNAAWKDGLTVEREDPLYRSWLRICSPDFPSRPQVDSTTTRLTPIGLVEDTKFDKWNGKQNDKQKSYLFDSHHPGFRRRPFS